MEKKPESSPEASGSTVPTGDGKGARARRHHRVRATLLVLVPILLVLGFFYVRFWLDVAAVRHFKHTGSGWSFPSKVYSDWLDLVPGATLPAGYLRAELEARGYTWTDAAKVETGQFATSTGSIRIGLRGFDYPDGRALPERVRVHLDGSKVVEVERAATGGLPPRVEPLFLAEWAGDQREERTWVPLDSIPKTVRDAVVSSEDRRFYSHAGFDVRGIARAMVQDVRGGGARQGGSTLTQQLARNLFLNKKKSVERKIRETLLAMALESVLSKNEILELYLNSVYLGQRGSSGVAGVQEAAHFFFDKPVSSLTLAESATLAAVIPAPNAFSPFRRPQLARERRDVILDAMAAERFISKRDAETAKATPVEVHLGPLPPALFPYYTDYARDMLRAMDRNVNVETRGLRVFTSLDPVRQKEAEQEVDAGLGFMGGPDLEGAFVLADLHTGAVRALVGGRDHSNGSFNRAYQSKRQPGSAFKPVVYAAAYDLNGGHSPWTPGSVVNDQQRDFKAVGEMWRPKNYEGDYFPTVSLAKALAKSLNVATAELVEKITATRVVDYAARFGLGRLKAVPSIALGTSEVTLVQLMAVFTTIGSDGRLTPLIAVRGLTDPAGHPVELKTPPRPQVLAPLTAHLMVEQLRNVVNFGTAFGLKGAYGFRRPAMGKTGTTNDEFDAWFMGATPDLAAGVWLGYDQPRSLYRSGAQAAVPLWARVMNRVVEGFPATEFPVHNDELEPATIDGYSGLLAASRCTSVIRTWFVRGTAPSRYCALAHLEPEMPDTTLGAGDSTFSSPFEEIPEEAPASAPPPPPPPN